MENILHFCKFLVPLFVPTYAYKQADRASHLNNSEYVGNKPLAAMLFSRATIYFYWWTVNIYYNFTIK